MAEMTTQQTVLRASDDAPPTLTPEAILQVGLGFWGSKTLLSAVELGALHRTRRRPPTPRRSRRDSGCTRAAAWDFLDALVALGMLEREEGVVPQHTGHGALPRPRQAVLHRRACSRWRTPGCTAFWGSLTEALRSGQPQNEAKARRRGLRRAVPRSRAARAVPARP